MKKLIAGISLVCVMLLTGCSMVNSNSPALDLAPYALEAGVSIGAHHYGSKVTAEDIKLLLEIVDEIEKGYDSEESINLDLGRNLILKKAPAHLVGPFLGIWTMVENQIRFEYEQVKDGIPQDAALYMKHALKGLKAGLESALVVKERK